MLYTLRDLYNLVPGSLMGKQINPLINSSNSLFRQFKSSPGQTLIKTLTKISKVIWNRTQEKNLIYSSVLLYLYFYISKRQRDLSGFILNVYKLHAFPTRQTENDRVLNVSGNSGFELWRSEKATDKCMQSLLKISIELENRMFSE